MLAGMCHPAPRLTLTAKHLPQLPTAQAGARQAPSQKHKVGSQANPPSCPHGSQGLMVLNRKALEGPGSSFVLTEVYLHSSLEDGGISGHSLTGDLMFASPADMGTALAPTTSPSS